MSNDRLKFRAWDPKRKVMHENVNIRQGMACVDEDAPADAAIVTVEVGGRRINAYSDWAKDVSKPDWIVMQWTGLHDNTGTEIYEGDRVVWGDDNVETVKFDDGMYVTDTSCLDSDSAAMMAVIGNIYDA